MMVSFWIWFFFFFISNQIYTSSNITYKWRYDGSNQNAIWRVFCDFLLYICVVKERTLYFSWFFFHRLLKISLFNKPNKSLQWRWKSICDFVFFFIYARGEPGHYAITKMYIVNGGSKCFIFLCICFLFDF